MSIYEGVGERSFSICEWRIPFPTRHRRAYGQQRRVGGAP